MTLQSQAGQLELLERRLREEQEHGTARRGDLDDVRRQKNEEIAQMAEERDASARERLSLQIKLDGGT